MGFSAVDSESKLWHFIRKTDYNQTSQFLAQLDFSTNPNKLIFLGAEYESIKKSGIRIHFFQFLCYTRNLIILLESNYGPE